MKSCCMILCLFFINSCINYVNTKSELLAYINNLENNIIKEDSILDINYKINYRPYSLYGTRLIDKGYTNIDSISEICKDPSKIHFQLSLSRNDKDLFYALTKDFDIKELGSKLNYKLVNYIKCFKDNKDTIYLRSSFFIKEYGSSNSTNLFLEYDKPSNYNDITLEIKDIVYSTENVITFNFKSEKIENTPLINLHEYNENKK